MRYIFLLLLVSSPAHAYRAECIAAYKAQFKAYLKSLQAESAIEYDRLSRDADAKFIFMEQACGDRVMKDKIIHKMFEHDKEYQQLLKEIEANTETLNG